MSFIPLGVLAASGAGGGGSFESIATANPSSTQIVTFSSINSTYKHLQLRIMGFTSSADNWNIRFNNDSSTSYTVHYLFGNGSSTGAGGYASPFDNKGSLNGLSYGSTNGSYPNVLIVDILDYANTSKNKTVRSIAAGDSNGSGGIALNSNLWLSTSAINRVDIVTSNYNMDSGTTIALYGIKG